MICSDTARTFSNRYSQDLHDLFRDIAPAEFHPPLDRHNISITIYETHLARTNYFYSYVDSGPSSPYDSDRGKNKKEEKQALTTRLTAATRAVRWPFDRGGREHVSDTVVIRLCRGTLGWRERSKNLGTFREHGVVVARWLCFLIERLRARYFRVSDGLSTR
ncbi:hypothetical protein GWI33_013898 [Rhynchophorus ferrugineus]|uniref:Uncharacterized protein n=1 Tax=Rhynchophorus ferrugineus TaxID=354439 RepID=A0A834I8B2_RHYFE|nr:hypothetical protein GWI33_013898 [Rhynchophorus ferrugineus]